MEFEIIKDILSVLGNVINGLSGIIMGLSFGFLSAPTALGYCAGIIGMLAFKTVIPINIQGETIVLAGSVGKNFRERISIVFYSGVIMVILGGLGLLQRIVDFAGSSIISGMEAGVGIIVIRVAIDLIKESKKTGAVSLISAFAAYLKIAPDSMKIEVRTLPADTSDYVERMRQYAEKEENDYCRQMIEDNIQEIGLGIANDAIRHRFFISFAYEAHMKARKNTVRDIIVRLNEEADTARRYLDLCELEVLEPRYADDFTLKLLYEIINKETGHRVKLPEGVFDMTTAVHGIYEE